jgi:hypothetical protein
MLKTPQNTVLADPWSASGLLDEQYVEPYE